MKTQKKTRERCRRLLDFGLTRHDLANILGNGYQHTVSKINGTAKFTEVDQSKIDYYYNRMLNKQADGVPKLTKETRSSIILDWLSN